MPFRRQATYNDDSISSSPDQKEGEMKVMRRCVCGESGRW